MKLNLNTDFTKFPRAVSVLSAGNAGTTLPSGRAILAHDERHLRRRAIELADGSKVLVDLPEPVALNDGDRLVLEDGGHVEIIAAPEEVYDIRARDGVHLAELAWHIGNRHLAASIEAGRILILRDHVIKAMLEGLGATVADVSEPFKPVRGAYSGHGGQSHDHGHAHAHSHAEAHSHSHDEAHTHSHSHAGHHHDHG
ncbi:urease accessory protein UreE [Mesorhizobium sp. M7A.F.Ca.CA.001.07.2.1]|uniref:urease accessory protein UreE n=1 Tax=Mesorhizobium TaxID=68287 RepID=UPI000FC9F14C|nr:MULTISPECIES: urease accessory protein UreE [Mesorhizobium]RVB45666.1 urease accessory protein UreE [Mesorhizobium sp. M7A.F.Ca.CA.004.05.1.1]MCF6124725.1 urease accessory protein UreE [Mesorhizobium ciceri]MCQ8814186.1 urease accessory protein UreE [Mesorhizobium sp. SEMIA396]RUX71530.1 urease accessory protein UreE [Mesorhizobium sp. M7A.F.Ca.CA.004.08.2.1]RUX83427.1 urease accessory protein UreE [Mesorhizobium sp. M7A.F.Ca.CA.004.08.1.1]